MSEQTDPSRPFDDIRNLVRDMPELETHREGEIDAILNSLGRGLLPLGALGRPLIQLANVQGADLPSVKRPLIAVFAGTHGVAAQLSEDDIVASSKARVASLTEGKAAVRGMSSSLGAAFKVYELALEYPSADFTVEASLSERDCAAAIAFGLEVVAEGADVILLGNAGFGAATASAAIAMSLYGGAANYWAGGQNAKTRVEAVSKAVNLHSGQANDPLETLRIFGGRDVAGMVGAILAAGHQRIPVLLDGYVSCAAAIASRRIARLSLPMMRSYLAFS